MGYIIAYYKSLNNGGEEVSTPVGSQELKYTLLCSLDLPRSNDRGATIGSNWDAKRTEHCHSPCKFRLSHMHTQRESGCLCSPGRSNEGGTKKENLPLEHIDFHVIAYWMSSIWSL